MFFFFFLKMFSYSSTRNHDVKKNRENTELLNGCIDR